MSTETRPSSRYAKCAPGTRVRPTSALSPAGGSQERVAEKARPVDAWLDWRAACQALGLSKSQFYRLVGAGELPAYRFGKRKAVRVRQSALRAFLHAHRLDADELDPFDAYETEGFLGLPHLG